MGQPVGEIAWHHLGHCGGAGGEIAHHYVVRPEIGPAVEVDGVRLALRQFLGRYPAGPRLADDDEMGKRGAVGAHSLDLLAMFGADDDGAGTGAVDPVGDVLTGQKIGARHRDDT
jgi:hypothetical protein